VDRPCSERRRLPVDWEDAVQMKNDVVGIELTVDRRRPQVEEVRGHGLEALAHRRQPAQAHPEPFCELPCPARPVGVVSPVVALEPGWGPVTEARCGGSLELADPAACEAQSHVDGPSWLEAQDEPGRARVRIMMCPVERHRPYTKRLKEVPVDPRLVGDASPVSVAGGFVSSGAVLAEET